MYLRGTLSQSTREIRPLSEVASEVAIVAASIVANMISATSETARMQAWPNPRSIRARAVGKILMHWDRASWAARPVRLPSRVHVFRAAGLYGARRRRWRSGPTDATCSQQLLRGSSTSDRMRDDAMEMMRLKETTRRQLNVTADNLRAATRTLAQEVCQNCGGIGGQTSGARAPRRRARPRALRRRDRPSADHGRRRTTGSRAPLRGDGGRSHCDAGARASLRMRLQAPIECGRRVLHWHSTHVSLGCTRGTQDDPRLSMAMDASKSRRPRTPTPPSQL